jgi:hypothetical protein
VSRIAVAVAALAIVAWLGVMERDARLQARGVDAAQRRDFAAAEADFRGARTLNPDTAADVNRAFLYERTARHGLAATTLEDVLRREPDNLTAWGLLFTFARNHDPATADRARAARRRLDPVSARGG